MSDLEWFFVKIRSKIFGGGKETLNKYLRKKGMNVGKGVKTASSLKTAEPYLITIGDNVTISHGVDFITHDNSVCKIYGVGHDLYGRITIGNNCFIGAHTVVMYGVSIADNVIVGAGSIVTKSIKESNVIVAGNPARIIGTWDNYAKKIKDNVIYTGHLSSSQKKALVNNSSFLMKK
jgi:acetyltransferase-like isoleucine patch superfamily enzyme